ncbi:MAG: hypothetical protein ACK5YZ_02965 [bacterium]|jgi:hypothetical protein
MGSIIYDFLTESVLFDESQYDDWFQRLSDLDLINELQKYRDFCINRAEEVEDEAVSELNAMCVFAGLKEVGLETLKQSALYVHKYILPDPLFPFSEKSSNISRATTSLLGYERPSLNREKLVATLKRMKSLTPMVSANYVRFLPISRLFEAPEQTPVYYSPNQFSDLLPPEALRFLQQKAIVKSLRKNEEGDGWFVENCLKQGRAILVDFEGERAQCSRIYHLFEQEVIKVEPDGSAFDFRLHLPVEPPSDAMFKAWVTQQVNRSAGDLFHRTQAEFTMSARLGASLMTDSPLENELLTRFFPTSGGASVGTANVLLNVDVPFLDGLSVEDLMRVRRDDGEVFENFRHELTKQFYDVQSEPDPVLRNAKAQKVFHDLGRVQTHQLEIKASDLKKGALANAVLLSAGLTGSILSVPSLEMKVIIGAIGTVAGVGKILSDYRAQIRSNPAFFLWNAMKK